MDNIHLLPSLLPLRVHVLAVVSCANQPRRELARTLGAIGIMINLCVPFIGITIGAIIEMKDLGNNLSIDCIEGSWPPRRALAGHFELLVGSP